MSTPNNDDNRGGNRGRNSGINRDSNTCSRNHLTGYIEHRLEFVASVSKEDDENKKKEVEKGEVVTKRQRQGEGRKRKYDRRDTNDHEQKQHQCINDHDTDRTDDTAKVGFFFNEINLEDDHDNNDMASCGVRIIVSHTMLKIICDVVRFRKQITLHNYSVISCRSCVDDNDCVDIDDGSNSTSRCNESINIEQRERREVKLIKLHHNGLTINHLNSSLKLRSQSKIPIPRYYDTLKTATVMSLVEVQQMEQNIEKERQRRKKVAQSNSSSSQAHKKKISTSSQQQNYNFRGKVDAISTIISVVPTDPFVLIELYDSDDHPSVSTVVVLKGLNAVNCQPGILPGDNLTFHNVIRSRWHVPQSFRNRNVPKRLHCRAPSHVFVVTDCNSIQWESPPMNENSKSSNSSSRETKQCYPAGEQSSIFHPIISIPPLPSTIESLVSIQGKVTSVEYTKIKGTKKQPIINIVHHIMIENNDEGDNTSSIKRYKLYVLYYPMSPDLYFGLVVGSYVRAMNMHTIPFTQNFRESNRNDYSYTCHGACLRSTITIFAHASDSHLLHILSTQDVADGTDTIDATYQMKGEKQKGLEQSICGPVHLKERQKATKSTIISHDQFYLFSNIKTSYVEREWITRIRQRAFENLSYTSDLHHLLQACISEWKTNSRKSNDDTCHQGSKSIRDPYKEWFDHACENTVDEEDDEAGVFVCPSTFGEIFPVVMGLSQLRTSCIQKMQHELQNHSLFTQSGYSNSTPVEIGWTSSIVIDADQLYSFTETSSLFSATQKSFHAGKNRVFFVGGIIAETSHNGNAIGYIHDGTCQLPLIPISKSKGYLQSIGSYQSGSFAMIKAQYVIISSFYLGRNNTFSVENNEEDFIKTSYLPPLMNCGANIKRGACQLTYFRGHTFISSIQIHYYMNDIISSIRTNSAHTNKSNYGSHAAIRTACSENHPACIYPLTKYIKSINQSQGNKERDGKYVGRFVHLCWRTRKSSNDYNGCTMNLSFAPIHRETHHTLASTQSIDLKLIIPLQTNNLEIVKNVFSKFLSCRLIQDMLVLASAWRALAEESRLCPIVVCDNDFSRRVHTNVFIPTTESKKFSHFRIDTIEVILKDRNESQLQTYQSEGWKLDYNPSTFVGGARKLMGELDSCIQRTVIHESEKKIYGELLLPSESFSGIPTLTLSLLKYRLLHDMSLRQPTNQLVWRIANAHLFTLKYCCVRIQCTKCFKYLVHDNTASSSNINIRDRKGAEADSSCDVSSPSFWHQPLPIRSNFRKTKRNNGQAGDRFCSQKLSCPSGCEYRHAYPKWEISGVISDSTGSAKLYAERDAALILLGRGLNIPLIERAAWQSNVGIVFQRGVPLNADIKNRIYQLRHLSSQKSKSHKGKDMMQMLPLTTRAKLELYQHCSSTNSTHTIHRKMDFICRCKQMSKRKCVLNPFDVSALSALGCGSKVMHSSHNSHMSPILELQLVDCIRCLEKTIDVGWSIMKSL